jgi:hypothetical protein
LFALCYILIHEPKRSTRILDEADSEFRPQEGALTVAQQAAHTAQTLD